MIRHATDQLSRKLHGQYYTDRSVGALLVNKLDHQKVETAIEFGVGPGALLEAVQARWPHAKCISVDIDPKHSLKVRTAARSHYCEDALNSDISRRIGLEPETADIAVCNPPFVNSAWKPEFRAILERAGWISRHTTAGFGADVLFLAQNLWMLRPNGQLGIIIPSGIICGERSRRIRDWLLSRHTISDVIELPAGAFRGTEVKTFVLYLRKGATTSAAVRLSAVTKNGKTLPEIYVSQSDASNRLDYSFYASNTNRHTPRSQVDQKPLQVIRGNVGTNILRLSGTPHIHTTDIISSGFGSIDLPNNSQDIPGKFVTARHGDVLLARVGRNFHQKVALVREGESIISDCIFALRSEHFSASEIYEAMISDDGQNWLKAHSRGACATFITKADLEMFPCKEMLNK